MSISDPIRLGAPYFNARPLVWGFVERPSPRIALVEAVPSRLASMVRDGALDAALISSIEAYRDGSLDALGGIGVASRGPVWSLRLFHRRPLSEVRSVALDVGSHTTAALTRILLADRYGNRPEFVAMDPDLAVMLDRHDAALLIGDPGLRSRASSIANVDLGEEWFAWTGLPMVYAVWAARRGALGEAVGGMLTDSLEFGLGRIDRIVEAEARPRGIEPGVARRYLTEIIQYRIGPDEEAGLARFLALARDHGLA